MSMKTRDDFIIRLADMLETKWSAFTEMRLACIKHDTTENIHDLRVATRRLRAALKLLEDLSLTGSRDNVYDHIRMVTGVLGHLRNLDELQLFVRRDMADEMLFSAALGVAAGLRSQEAERMLVLLNRLDVTSLQQQIRHIEKHIRHASMSGIIGRLSSMGISCFGKVHGFMHCASVEHDDKHRHALRIAIKKWRYFLEIVSELFHSDNTEILATLKEYQTVLGRLNDYSVFGASLPLLRLDEKQKEKLMSALSLARTNDLDKLNGMLNSRPIMYSFNISPGDNL